MQLTEASSFDGINGGPYARKSVEKKIYNLSKKNRTYKNKTSKWKKRQ